jgi:Ring finger domain
MDILRLCRLSIWVSTLLLTQTLGQWIAPSNDSSDLLPIASSPRFFLNGTELGSLPVVRLAPLKPYAESITKSNFLQIDQSGQLVNLDASNVNELQLSQFGYLSCDPSAYTGFLNASQVFDLAFNSGNSFILILYSVTANHCSLNGVNVANTGSVNAVLTTVDPVVASMLANLNLNAKSSGTCAILPDLNSFTNVSSSNNWNNNAVLGPSPTTAVAMIILYSITGLITALFVIIIITGAIRAHRHPERYGPRILAGRGRQSRAKGIARAMLETLPIIKFGDHQDLPVKPAGEADIEMNAADTTRAADAAATNEVSTTSATDTDGAAPTKDSASISNSVESAGTIGGHMHNPDGTQDDGSLGCSICTEDFHKGEEVRVLPCNHKFHPECVDPWLLNVSGTCPLCRIDLRPKDEQGEVAESEGAEAGTATVDGERGADPSVLPPPLEGTPAGVRRDTLTALRGFATGTREERISALRRLREERRRRGASGTDGEVERRGRRGVTERLRTRFSVRTMLGGGERRGLTEEGVRSGSTG